jgi:putative Mn2+ efflux pump MntP
MVFPMSTLNSPLHKYVVMFLMLFLIVALGNMLGEYFGNPLESYKNTMGAF